MIPEVNALRQIILPLLSQTAIHSVLARAGLPPLSSDENLLQLLVRHSKHTRGGFTIDGIAGVVLNFLTHYPGDPLLPLHAVLHTCFETDRRGANVRLSRARKGNLAGCYFHEVDASIRRDTVDPKELSDLRGDMSVEDFSDLVGRTAQSIGAWEAGKRSLTRAALARMRACVDLNQLTEVNVMAFTHPHVTRPESHE